MSEGRALLTEKEREAIAGEASDSYRYKTRSYFRDRLASLRRDLTVLEKHDEELLEELREVVCEEQTRSSQVRAEEPAAMERDEEVTVNDPVEGIELEGSGSRLEARKDALRAIVAHLREHDAATASELKEILAEHEHGYDDADGAWANFRRQNALDELPVETPGQGGRTYRYSPNHD